MLVFHRSFASLTRDAEIAENNNLSIAVERPAMKKQSAAYAAKVYIGYQSFHLLYNPS
jgi:hypothetical protein